MERNLDVIVGEFYECMEDRKENRKKKEEYNSNMGN